MIQIFVEGTQLDLFQEESIELSKSIKRLNDIGNVYTPFTQSFTVPASRTNNQVFKHYYRDDLNEGVSGLYRIPCTITLAGQIFEKGTLIVEGANVRNGNPYSYTLGFYGASASFTEITGGDTLQALDFSDYDHEYTSSNIRDGFDGTGISGISNDELIYPIFSPVRNWIYDSDTLSNPDNIAYVSGTSASYGINYYELKPALKVTKILDAIEDYYDITFTGSFLSSAPFNQLYMWLHNREGYTYEGQDSNFEPSINKEIIKGLSITNNSGGFAIGIPVSQQATFITTQDPNVGLVRHYAEVSFNTLTSDATLYLTLNGQIIDTVKADSTGVTYTLGSQSLNGAWSLNPAGGTNVFKVLIGKTAANLTYDLDLDFKYNALTRPNATLGTSVSCTMSSSVTNTEDVVVGNLLPDITVSDFINALIKMYNLVITSEDGTTYNFETRDDFYGAGNELDLDRWINNEEVEVTAVPKYRAINFRYAESGQILQKQFRNQNQRGYGDLVQNFNFDSPEVYSVDVPFDHLYTEKLTDAATESSVDFTVYKSIDIDEDNAATSYYGSPVLFYLDDTIDISATPVAFVNESGTKSQIDTIYFCEDVNDTTASSAESTTFSQEQNPYLEQEPNDNLYSYWSSLIINTYDARTRVYYLDAYLNFGVISRINLNDTILWKGRKYLINDMNINLTTGKTRLELITNT